MVPTRLRSAATALLTLAALGAALATFPAGAPAAQTVGKGKGKTDKELFQGKWEVIAAEKGGEKLPDEILKAIKLSVKGDKIEVEILGENKEGVFKLDATKKPKEIDLTVDCKTLKGIYEFTKDALKVCAPVDADGARPKDFKSDEGTLLVTFKRVKGEKKEKGEKEKGEKKGAGGSPKETAEQARLKGVWVVVSASKGSEKLPDEILKTIKVGFDGNKLKFEFLGDTKDGTYQVDPTQSPASIDMTIDGKTAQGIYRLGKDKLEICAAEPGQARPKEFKAGDDQQMLVVLKRAAAAKEKKKAKTDNPEEARECSQDGALRMASINNLKQIGLAMHSYHDANRGFPAAAIYGKDGKPLLSWRVALLPYLEQNNLYKQFKLDEPWDSAHNKKLLEKMPRVYALPGVDSREPHSTYYRVFTGPGTVFEGVRGIRITSISDGMSNTILAVEARDEVPWTKPDELPYEASKALPKLGASPKGGFLALMADGSVRTIRREFDPRILRLAITRNDGQVADFDSLSP